MRLATLKRFGIVEAFSKLALLIWTPTAAALAAGGPLVYIFPGTARQVTGEPERSMFSVHTFTPKVLKPPQSQGSKRRMFISAVLFALIIITFVAAREER